MIFNKLRTEVKIILAIQTLSMLGGASTHLLWTMKNGFLSPQYDAPLLSMIFWDALTFLDPIAALLLIFKPKFGIYLTAAIIVIDVLHNNILLPLLTNREIEIEITNWMIVSQLVFLAFVVLTFKTVRQEIELRMVTRSL
jgi:hypothetical protein